MTSAVDCSITMGRDLCGDLHTAATREWLVTNGIGGYACGTVAGVLTRRYHGLLVAALKPPLQRTLLVTKLDEVVHTRAGSFAIATNRWADGTVEPMGYRHIERFQLEGTVPRWHYACGDALLEKQVWMRPGANTTYIQYRLRRSSAPIQLSIKAFVNYRDHHGDTQAQDWQMQVVEGGEGIEIRAFPGAIPIYLRAEGATVIPRHTWHDGFDLALERYRGLQDREDHLQVADIQCQLAAGQTLTVVASTEPTPNLVGDVGPSGASCP